MVEGGKHFQKLAAAELTARQREASDRDEAICRTKRLEEVGASETGNRRQRRAARAIQRRSGERAPPPAPPARL